MDNNVTKAFVNYPAIIVSSSYNYKKANKDSFREIKNLFRDAKSEKIGVMQVCSWTDIDKIKNVIGEDVIYYYGDGDIAKIIIRSDPGLLLFKNGVLIKKWHSNNVPSIKEIKNLLK